MTNTVFSTVDRFASKFKLIDSLINSVAERLLPQHEAQAGYNCGAGAYHCRNRCRGEMCREDLGLYYGQYVCCDSRTGQDLYSYDYCGC
ncbi:hypothetical protein [Reticulibacter mediterranei]|uniref:hypothetical protein n=1 Tax=Reticulibacter mediterranei TaxID=2778369 RepID=UPI001C68C74A|nr:hypothetical protein [Reticulibacter mediterranei]